MSSVASAPSMIIHLTTYCMFMTKESHAMHTICMFYVCGIHRRSIKVISPWITMKLLLKDPNAFLAQLTWPCRGINTIWVMWYVKTYTILHMNVGLVLMYHVNMYNTKLAHSHTWEQVYQPQRLGWSFRILLGGEIMWMAPSTSKTDTQLLN